MRPAFSSSSQAVAFAALLLFFLALPVVLRCVDTRRELAYESEPLRAGAYTYIKQQIFGEKDDIDILFLGSSTLWHAIDAPYMRDELSALIGRKANVLVFGTNWRGEDLNYAVLKDVLSKRRIHLLVLSMPTTFQRTDGPQVQSYRWISYSDADFFQNLPQRAQMAFYAEQVLGAPRRLLSMLRPDISENSEYASTLGCSQARDGFNRGPFIPTDFKAPLMPPEDMISSTQTSDRFLFLDRPLNKFQTRFFELTANLAKENGIPVIVLHLPIFEERRDDRCIELTDWSSKVFHSPCAIVGVPPARLFESLTDDDILKLFADPVHLNANGNKMFTRAVAPAIFSLYERYNRSDRVASLRHPAN